MTDPDELAAIKTFAIELSRDPAEMVSARGRALMACIVIPPEIQKWMLEAGAVEPLLDSIEQTILAAEKSTSSEPDMRAFSASDAACYLWPEDTTEHRNLRAAYIRGAADCGGALTAGERQNG